MSDQHIAICALNLTEEEAETCKDKVINYLVSREIILPTKSHCIMSETGTGYPPGPKFIQASWFDKEQPQIINANYEDFSKRTVNGLEVLCGRQGVYNASGDWSDKQCPDCKLKSAQDKDWSEAVTEWLEHKGEGLLTCPHCGSTASVSQWYFYNDMLLGNLIFQFWNWPELSDEFIADLSDVLGCDLRMISGRL